MLVDSERVHSRLRAVNRAARIGARSWTAYSNNAVDVGSASAVAESETSQRQEAAHPCAKIVGTPRAR